MSKINVLDKNTINQIAAGEVIERPASVIKELMENSIDAGATIVSCEISGGGIDLIRVTDNGSGILEEDIKKAFLRHATSKITCASDLAGVMSLGFRGEALASIAAVAEVECITKTESAYAGMRYCIADGEEISFESVGCPTGTTFIIRNLFKNVPVRRKFLKSASTEASYVNELIEHIALSHPEVSVKYTANGRVVLFTPGNGSLKDVIFSVYGKEIAGEALEVGGRLDRRADEEDYSVSVEGYAIKPIAARSNRNCELTFINGRFIRSKVLSKAVEDAYSSFLMQHKYPFVVLHLEILGDAIDVNVHPTKQEVRFEDPEVIYELVYGSVLKALKQTLLVPKAIVEENARVKPQISAKLEFAENPGATGNGNAGMKQDENPGATGNVNSGMKPDGNPEASRNGNATMQQNVMPERRNVSEVNEESTGNYHPVKNSKQESRDERSVPLTETPASSLADNKQESCGERYVPLTETPASSLADNRQESCGERYVPSQETTVSSLTEIEQENPAKATSEDSQTGQKGGRYEQFVLDTSIVHGGDINGIRPETADEFRGRMTDGYRIVGQVFDTYWIVQIGDEMYIIDQHAAHEKIIFEQLMEQKENEDTPSQEISPALIVSLDATQYEKAMENSQLLKQAGFEIQEFGGREIAVTSIPLQLFGLEPVGVLMQLIDSFDISANQRGNVSGLMSIRERIATCACKAAVKGNNRLSYEEAQSLIHSLMKCDNPFNCPHGRPVFIRMTKNELEKKFKRIV